MKKLYPYILPALSLFFVLFLAFRWYNLRTQRENLNSMGEGVEIENLSESEAQRVMKGVGDFQSVVLEDATNSGLSGMVRYEMANGRVLFSVSAQLPQISQGSYQVWLKEAGKLAKQRAFVLEVGKAGYIGSASISSEKLPVEVIVTGPMAGSTDEVLLKGMIDSN